MKTGPKQTPLAERMEGKYSRASSGCWIWSASKGTSGYGQIGFRGRPIGSHRAAYLAWVGEIPSGLDVCHRCDVKLCVNPEHLFIGTPAENAQDMAAKGRAYMGKGERHPAAKLKEKDVLSIVSDSRSETEIAKMYGVSRSLVGLIKRREIWGHLHSERLTA